MADKFTETPFIRQFKKDAAELHRRMETADLLPCPFCGGNDLGRGVRFADGSSVRADAVRCRSCGVQGPLASWNKRSELAVRAVIQMGKASNDEHYLKCIKLRLAALYDLTSEPNIREQLSDEISWVEEKLGIAE